jgi:hypothetical protein
VDEFLKMDIFFVVATAAVVVLVFYSACVMWRLQRILKNIEHISEQVAGESDDIRHALAEMRGDIRRGRGRLMSLFDFLGKFGKRRKNSG